MCGKKQLRSGGSSSRRNTPISLVDGAAAVGGPRCPLYVVSAVLCPTKDSSTPDENQGPLSNGHPPFVR
jgi:hypothetical protein